MRPVVASAIQAGHEVIAFDFFADWDTQYWLRHGANGEADSMPKGEEGACSCSHLIGTKEELIAINAQLRCDSAIICGGFENRIQWVRRILEHCPVYGPSPEDLRQLTNLELLFSVMKEEGFCAPPTLSQIPENRGDSRWLRKLGDSSGGLGVSRFQAGFETSPHDRVYFQEEISGEPISAIFISTSNQRSVLDTAWLSASRQLVGKRELGGNEFAYCGSISGAELTNSEKRQIELIGGFLSKRFGLVGIWGIDFIQNAEGLWPVDVNPRIVASAELYESTIRELDLPFRGVVDLHVQACQGLDLKAIREKVESVSYFANVNEGKAILYWQGETSLNVTEELAAQLRSQFDPSFFLTNRPGQSIADVPRSGVVIEPGHPVLTLRIRAEHKSRLEAKLFGLARETYDMLQRG